MDEILYNGKKYIRYNNKWTDTNYRIVHQQLQYELNKAFSNSIDDSRMNCWQLIKEGDKYKNTRSIGLAISWYEKAVDVANEKDMAYILPRLTSCYRIKGEPQKAIDILEFAKEKYGSEIITSVLLTSAAAAYCDLEEYDNALSCYYRAVSKLNGRTSDELSAVYSRIIKEENK